ncbi:MAG: phosphatidylglycerophosphatase A [Peptococcaceae bacterium]
MRPALIKFFATGCGTGYFKPGPGTWGSLFALLIWLIYPGSVLRIVSAAIGGLYICQKAEILFAEHDSPSIVWDEIVGMWIALWQIPLILYPLAFLLFRFLDIVKPYPINHLQKLPGGLGIMIDDIIAGLIARLILVLIMVFL